MTAPDMRGRLRAHPRARRQGRRGRPAPHAHRRGGRRAPLHPPRHRRALLLAAWRTRSSRRGSTDPGRLAEHVRRARRGARRWSRELHPEAVAARLRHRRRARSGAWRASWRPPSGPRSTGASAPAPRSSARSPAGWSTSSTCSPATSTARAARCSPARPPGSGTRPASRAEADEGVRLGRWHSRVRGLPEAFGELPVAALAEEIDTPGEGQVRALVTAGRQPAGLHAEQRPPRAGRSRGSTSWSRSTSTSTRRPVTPT